MKSAKEFFTFSAVRPCASVNKKRAGAYTVCVKRILFTGGGSAGHVVPNLAVMQELKGRYELAYMGTDGIERGLVASFGCPYFLVNCPKLVRSVTPKNLAIPFRLAAAQKRALCVLRERTPDLVFAKGGYASFPAVWAAHRLKVPVLTHESDLSPGLCTRLVARKCRYVLTSFPETAKKIPERKIRRLSRPPRPARQRPECRAGKIRFRRKARSACARRRKRKPRAQ